MKCPSCGSRNVVMSHNRVARWVGTELIRRHRCRDCKNRFLTAQRVLTTADAERLPGLSIQTVQKAGSETTPTGTATYAPEARVSLRTTASTDS